MKAMSIPKIVVTVIQILSGLFLIAVVLLQSGKSRCGYLRHHLRRHRLTWKAKTRPAGVPAGRAFVCSDTQKGMFLGSTCMVSHLSSVKSSME